jgi:tetratricopeptide (TPR) repeat protein
MVRTARYFFAFGCGALYFVVGSWLASVPGGKLPAVATCAMGAVLIALGVWSHFAHKLQRFLDAAVANVAGGRLDEGEAVLDSLPKWASWRSVNRREVHLQRATIALLRGDPAKAREQASRAVGGSGALLSRAREDAQRMAAHCLRAVAAANQDDAPTVSADAAVVRSTLSAAPEHLAYVAVAEAILLARASRRDELVGLLARERELLCDYTTPHYRALVRALQRMVASPRSVSAYREQAKPEELAEPELKTWIAGVVPAAEIFATTFRSADRESLPQPTEELANGARRRPAVTDSNLVRRMILAPLFGVVVLVAYLQTNRHHFEPWTVPAVYVLLPALSIGFAMLRQRKMQRLARARRLILSDSGACLEMLRALATEQIVAARADAALVEIAIRQARFDDAVMHCDRAISRFPKDSETLLPELLSRRAYALAALGRPEEARADLQELETKYPTYARQLHTRIMLAVQRGDLAVARALARQRTPSLPLGRHSEVLADVLVVTGDASAAAVGEVERLATELREDQRLRDWLRAVWPGWEVELNSVTMRRRVGADAEVEDERSPSVAVAATRVI